MLFKPCFEKYTPYKGIKCVKFKSHTINLDMVRIEDVNSSELSKEETKKFNELHGYKKTYSRLEHDKKLLDVMYKDAISDSDKKELVSVILEYLNYLRKWEKESLVFSSTTTILLVGEHKPALFEAQRAYCKNMSHLLSGDSKVKARIKSILF